MIRASCPRAASLRAQRWALALASIASAADELALGTIDGVHLDHAPGQFDAHAHGLAAHSASCSLLPGLPKMLRPRETPCPSFA